MQSLEASKNYRNSFVCAAKIFKDEGILTFWSGAVPRLARLIMSGGIVFTMFVYLTSVSRELLLTFVKGTRRLWRPWIPLTHKGSIYNLVRDHCSINSLRDVKKKRRITTEIYHTFNAFAVFSQYW